MQWVYSYSMAFDLVFESFHPFIPAFEAPPFFDADVAILDSTSTVQLADTDAVSNTAYAEEHFVYFNEEIKALKRELAVLTERIGALRQELQSIQSADGAPYNGRFSEEVLKELLLRLKKLEDQTSTDYFLLSGADKFIHESPDHETLGGRLRNLNTRFEMDHDSHTLLEMSRDRVSEYKRELMEIKEEIEALKRREA